MTVCNHKSIPTAHFIPNSLSTFLHNPLTGTAAAVWVAVCVWVPAPGAGGMPGVLWRVFPRLKPWVKASAAAMWLLFGSVFCQTKNPPKIIIVQPHVLSRWLLVVTLGRIHQTLSSSGQVSAAAAVSPQLQPWATRGGMPCPARKPGAGDQAGVYPIGMP